MLYLTKQPARAEVAAGSRFALISPASWIPVKSLVRKPSPKGQIRLGFTLACARQ
jgi:hypothetical protein